MNRSIRKIVITFHLPLSKDDLSLIPSIFKQMDSLLELICSCRACEYDYLRW
jgi:hypothetical protein